MNYRTEDCSFFLHTTVGRETVNVAIWSKPVKKWVYASISRNEAAELLKTRKFIKYS